MRRTPPFSGFSRGIPIVGERPETPPKGLYYYQVPVLIMRDGRGLEADSFEFRFPLPLEGVQFKTLVPEIVGHLKAVSPGLSEPRVVVLAPFFLGFVPQHAIDRAAEETAAPGGGES